MSSELIYYAFCIAVLIVGILIVKKIAGCLLKSLTLIIVTAILAAIWYLYLR